MDDGRVLHRSLIRILCSGRMGGRLALVPPFSYSIGGKADAVCQQGESRAGCVGMAQEWMGVGNGLGEGGTSASTSTAVQSRSTPYLALTLCPSRRRKHHQIQISAATSTRRPCCASWHACAFGCDL